MPEKIPRKTPAEAVAEMASSKNALRKDWGVLCKGPIFHSTTTSLTSPIVSSSKISPSMCFAGGRTVAINGYNAGLIRHPRTVLVTATQKQSTRYSLSSGAIESQVNWDSSCGLLRSIEEVDFAGGHQRIVGRCSGDYTTWVSMNVDDGSIDSRLPIFSSSGGDPWGSFYHLFRRAGDLPSRIAVRNSHGHTVLQTIGSGEQASKRIVTSVYRESSSTREDRRLIRNLPGSRNAQTSINTVVTSLVSTIFGLTLFVIPFVYLRKLLRRQFSIRHALAAFPVVAIVLATLGLPTPKMWSSVSSPLASLTFGLLGATLIVALFTVARSTLQRRWVAPALAVLFLIVANSYSVVVPIVQAWTESPPIRYHFAWTNFLEPSLLAIHAFGLACIIVFAIKHVAVSLRDTLRQPVRLGETDLHESP